MAGPALTRIDRFTTRRPARSRHPDPDLLSADTVAAVWPELIMRKASTDCDLAILGGGLAGLCLALQIKRRAQRPG